LANATIYFGLESAESSNSDHAIGCYKFYEGISMNYLYLGDCLDVLQDYVKDESVDLIYIDPPFNSKRNYNVFFDDKEIQVQRLAFEDTWSLKNVNDSMQQLRTVQREKMYNLLRVYQEIAPQVFPYLVMMTLRIIELHRVLKPTGSFYLHCDPTASHYLKTVCDAVFGANHFKNEIIWQRINAKGNVQRKFGAVHDTLYIYTKKLGEEVWNQPYRSLNPEYVNKMYRHLEEGTNRRYRLSDLTVPIQRASSGQLYEWKGKKPVATRCWVYAKEKMEDLEQQGRIVYSKNDYPSYKRYLDEIEGEKVPDVWGDINPALSKEFLGYPTQKPLALLERIIQASSNEGNLILDAFCGCGTTVTAAEGLNRQWIGIDISPFAISLIKRRLQAHYKGDLHKLDVRGIPTDEKSAIKLWEHNAFAFQDWWITEFEAFSTTFGKKGADKGVDGIAKYALPGTELKVAFQVKGGEKVQSKDIDALLGAMVKHKCELGVFLTRAEATKPMLETIVQMGHHDVNGFSFPKLQLLTLQEFFAGKRPHLPATNITFKTAESVGKGGTQEELSI
jgi:site-specific DNA-methyltransferase (adenine-specific)